MALILKATASSNLTGLPVLRRDALLRDDLNGGVKHIFDLGFQPFGYSGASPVVSDALVRDLSETSNGRVFVTAGQTVPLAGNGLDCSTLVSGAANRAYVEIPVDFAQAVYANSQNFLICAYFRLPLASDWKTDAGLAPMLGFANGANGYASVADLASIYQQGGASKLLVFGRQTAIGTIDSMNITVPDNAHGAVAQVAMWRNASGQGARIKTADTSSSATKARGTDSSVDFSSNKGFIGVGPALWGSLNNANINAFKFRVYRGFFEALSISNRDPIAVLDADWNRVAARNVFS